MTPQAEAELDVAALLRARLAGDAEGIRAILAGAGPDGTAAIALVLLGALAETLARYAAAAALIKDDDDQEWVMSVPAAELMADEWVRDGLETSVADAQAKTISAMQHSAPPPGKG